MKEQESLNKSYAGQVSKLEKELRTVHSRLQKARERSETQTKAAEGVLYVCENFRRNPQDQTKSDPQMQDRLNLDMGNALRASKETADAYKSFFQYTREFEGQFKSAMANILSSYQSMEEKKVQTIKDCLRKLLIFETAMDQNRKYDVEHISTTIEDISVEQTVQTLIESNKPKDPPAVTFAPDIAFPKSPWSPLIEIYEANYFGKEDFMDYTRVVEETKAHITRAEDPEYRKLLGTFTSLFESIFAEPVSPTKSQSTAPPVPVETLGTAKGRLAFLDSLRKFSAAGRTRVTQTGYKSLALLMLGFLDRAYQELEAEQIYQAIAEARKVYWSNEGEDKETLMFAVKTHDVWRDQKFWTKALRNELDSEIRIQRNILLREAEKTGRDIDFAERHALC